MNGNTPSPLTEAELGAVWSRLQDQVNPFNKVLSIPGDVFRGLDTGAKSFIANAFMAHIKEQVMYCRDGSGHDRYFLGNPLHFVGENGIIIDVVSMSEPFWFPTMDTPHMATVPIPNTSAPTTGSTRANAKDKKIPRPPNAYILYRKERHAIVKRAQPDITNNEISQVLGAAWNCETPEIRQKYKKMADDIKKAFLHNNPEYTYRPRKPSEKRKRTRRAPQSGGASSQNDGGLASSASSPDVTMAATPSSTDT